ncbi:hypothetical protein G6F60_015700 [Rhizopus arrhizus]|nr:hypothetical protein G6F60_015700 [Rhizopus arrhizus]
MQSRNKRCCWIGGIDGECGGNGVKTAAVMRVMPSPHHRFLRIRVGRLLLLNVAGHAQVPVDGLGLGKASLPALTRRKGYTN